MTQLVCTPWPDVCALQHQQQTAHASFNSRPECAFSPRQMPTNLGSTYQLVDNFGSGDMTSEV